MYLLGLEFCFGRRRLQNCGMHIFDCTTSSVANGTRIFVLIFEGLVTGDPWFETTSQLCSVVR